MQYNFEKFPIIEFDDLILREIELSDANEYFQYMSHESIKPYIISHNIPTNLLKAECDLTYWKSVFEQKYSIYWAIAYKEDNKMLGTVGFNYISKEHSRAEISYDLNHNFWSKGIMTRAIKKILEFSDAELRLVRIQATTLIFNKASVKLLEKCGFQKEGVLRNYELVHNNYPDSFMYSRINYKNI